MHAINIYTHVTGNTLTEFLDNLSKTQQIAESVHLRTDYIQNLKTGDVAQIKAAVTKPAIFACRRQDEGGSFKGSEEERLQILYAACAVGFSHIDLELAGARAFDLSKKMATKFVISYHDFKGTPDLYKLNEIVVQMRAHHADMLKFATLVNTEEDIHTLFSLLLNKQPGDKMIISGMGERGRMTRVLAPLLGAYLTFASTEYAFMFPGQIHLLELKDIYSKLIKY